MKKIEGSIKVIRQNSKKAYQTTIVTITSVIMGYITFMIDNFIRNSIITVFSAGIGIFVSLFVAFTFITKSQETEHEKLINETNRKHNEQMNNIVTFYGTNQMNLMLQIKEVVNIISNGKSLDKYELVDPMDYHERKGLPIVEPIKKKER